MQKSFVNTSVHSHLPEQHRIVDIFMVPRTHSVRRGHSVLKINFLAVAIFVQKLRKFSTKPLPNFFLDFSRFGLSIKSWKLAVMHPLPLPQPIWDFSRYSASNVGSWPSCTPPPPSRFGILADLDSVSKVGSWPSCTPPSS